jgi:hypothetical protein
VVEGFQALRQTVSILVNLAYSNFDSLHLYTVKFLTQPPRLEKERSCVRDHNNNGPRNLTHRVVASLQSGITRKSNKKSADNETRVVLVLLSD